ncbi:TonB-dependent receptor plug domain-containing protein [Pedobacter cryoconitis]|uniref:TonB-dependent receptor plug domain-containing protein n=1 Tax=Pedobacter cryoconitis TaxID=188932 RepID=UPI00161A4972|nr:TonB-dependent receptor [Pedobacter cryoconitis]MBB5645535.1 iron complex outermembrane receptor protein [Pedobacter cryoconitis]
MKKMIPMLVTLCLSAGYAAAQSDTTKNLNEVMVRENRLKLPFSKQNRNIWIIDNQQIKNLPSRSISELLSYVTGVDVRQRGPGGVQADISIDGGTFDQTLVLINGVKVSDPQTGHNMMNLPISVDDIDHIEVLRGSASRIYGTNALTGAINIVTKAVTRTSVSANVFTGSSFKKDEVSGDTYANYGVRATGTLALKESSHLFSAGQEAGNGYRYNTAFNNQKFFYEGKVNVGKTDQLEITGGYIHNKFGANGYYSSPGDKEAEETVKTAIAAVAYKTQLTSFWSLMPRLSYRNNVDDYLYIKQTPDKFHNHHVTQVLSAELNNSFQTGIGEFGLGLETRKEKINSTNLGKRNRDNAGIYGEYKFDLVKNLLVNVGSYVNYNSDYGWQAFPGIDAGYNFYGNWKVFVNVGTGQRLPTFTDLYYKGPTNIGNDQLQPEKSRYAEGGIKYNSTHFVLNASLFKRRITNFIDWVKDKTTDPWQPKNFSELNTMGYTLSADYNTGALENSAFNSLRFGLAYTYLDPKVKTTLPEANISRYAVESLKNQLTATVNAEFLKVMALTVTARYCERISYKDYTVMDARLTYKLKRSSIYADASNIFDVNFIQAGAVPMPGVWATLGYKIAL